VPIKGLLTLAAPLNTEKANLKHGLFPIHFSANLEIWFVQKREKKTELTLPVINIRGKRNEGGGPLGCVSAPPHRI
jgi:hypothetical protein